MWEVMTYGERPYWELSNHEVSPSLSQTDPLSDSPRFPNPGALASELWDQSASSTGTCSVAYPGENPASAYSEYNKPKGRVYYMLMCGVHVYIHMCDMNMWISACRYMNVYVHIHVYVCVCNVYIHICMHIYMYLIPCLDWRPGVLLVGVTSLQRPRRQ